MNKYILIYEIVIYSLGVSLTEEGFEGLFLFFIAIPLIIVISYYLMACTFAPIFGLNYQIFKILFTLAGAIPTIFFYLKNSTTKNYLRNPKN
jgi:hypothetical protein